MTTRKAIAHASIQMNYRMATVGKKCVLGPECKTIIGRTGIGWSATKSFAKNSHSFALSEHNKPYPLLQSSKPS